MPALSWLLEVKELTGLWCFLPGLAWMYIQQAELGMPLMPWHYSPLIRSSTPRKLGAVGMGGWKGRGFSGRGGQGRVSWFGMEGCGLVEGVRGPGGAFSVGGGQSDVGRLLGNRAGIGGAGLLGELLQLPAEMALGPGNRISVPGCVLRSGHPPGWVAGGDKQEGQ